MSYHFFLTLLLILLIINPSGATTTRSAPLFGLVRGIPTEDLKGHGRVTLFDGQFSSVALIDVNGKFSLNNVTLGLHSLTITFDHYYFPVYKLLVTASRSGEVKFRAVVNEGPTSSSSMLSLIAGGDGVESYSPMEFSTMGAVPYFIPREEYSIWGIVKSPMMLLMGLPMLLLWITKMMPKEEVKAQMKELRKMQEDGKKALSFGGDSDKGKKE